MDHLHEYGSLDLTDLQVDLEDMLSSSILDLIRKPNNTPGLGDFHLRSAITLVDVNRLVSRNGRYNENGNYEMFSRTWGNPPLISGDPTELLSIFLVDKGDLISSNQQDRPSMKMSSYSIEKARQCVINRITMELNRTTTDDYDSRTSKGSIRVKTLKSFMNATIITEYSKLRHVVEKMLIVANSMGSQRELPSYHHELFDYLDGGDFNKKACLILLRDMQFHIASELLFVKKTSPLCSEKSGGIHLRNNGWQVYSIDVLRMICDKVTERDICLRACELFSPVLPTVYPNPNMIRRIFLIGDDCMVEFGNRAYKFFKIFESVLIGVLLSRCETLIVDKEEFLNTTISDFERENPDMVEYTTRLLEELKNIVSDHHLSQIYGLYRLWGHPSVSSLEGLAKVRRLGKAEKICINDSYAKDSGRYFLESFFMKYFDKWGRYPSFSIIPQESSDVEQTNYLLRSLICNTKILRNSDLYSILDWDYVIPEKTLSIPETFNLTMVVDDKAISPPKDFLIDVASKKKRAMDPYERRGVLKWMNASYKGCSEFLLKIDEEGLEDKDCVIGLYPKERELNSTPRMFSLMSSEMRNYVVVTEHMIADDILPFFPEITMTDNLLDLTKKIYSSTRSQESAKKDIFLNNGKNRRSYFEVTVCVNMDFEKWNLNMRYESTKHVFEWIGRLYGMPNLINRTYEIFNKSYIYVCDDSYKIETKMDKDKRVLKTDEVHSYSGHVGGFEGLRQKGWTIFTVSTIKMILAKYSVSYNLMGQGDNQVLMLNIKTGLCNDDGSLSNAGRLELQATLEKIMKDLEHTFGMLGLPLKTLESWKSEDFFLYGKFPVKKGVPLSMSLKKMCRAFPFSNDDTMTIDNILGSIFTNAQSGSMSDVIHLPSYYLGLFESYAGLMTLINYDPMIGKSIGRVISEKTEWSTINNISKDSNKVSPRKISIQYHTDTDLETFVELLCLMPKSLGGSNGITEYEFLMRGFPDNQTRDLTYLTELMSSNSHEVQFEDIIKGIMRFIRFNISDMRNYDFLVEDPCALNLIQPETPLTMLRKKIKRILGSTKRFKNEHFMELFTLTSDSKKRDLLNKLAEQDTLFPRLLHDCYSASLYGFVDGIISKVDKTVTIQRMCLAESQEDVYKAVFLVEENYIRYLYWRVSFFRSKPYPLEPDYNCPTNYIRWLRNFGWGKEVLGVTVPYPSHTLSICPDSHISTCDGSDLISCHISDYAPMSPDLIVSKLGRSPPYLGSKTKEKIKTYERIALYSSEPLVRRIVRLMRTIGWGHLENSNLQLYLEDLLSSVSDVSPDIFLINKEDIGGSIEHRYQDGALKHGALLSNMYGLATWLHLSTDRFSKFSKGSKNVTLHFQAMLCWVQSLMFETLLSRERSKCSHIKEFHFHLNCEDCIMSVEYQIPDISSIDKSLIPHLKENPYCYVKNVAMTVNDRSLNNCPQLFRFKKNLKIQHLSTREAKMMFHEYWAWEIVQDISSGEMSDVAVGTSIMELSKYPRIAFLRIDPEILLNMISSFLVFGQLKSQISTDEYLEKSCGLWNISKVVSSELKKKHPSCFIGLAVLFSWNEKMEQIREIDPSVFPKETNPSISDYTASGKKLLISYLDLVPELIRYYSRYINLANKCSIHHNIIFKYIFEMGLFQENHCPHCIKAIVDVEREDLFDSISGLESCPYGHLIWDKHHINKRFPVVYFPEDLLSKKNASMMSIVKKETVIASDDLIKDNTLCNKHTAYHNILRWGDAERTESMPYIEEGEYRPNALRISQIYKIIPNELSSCYRVLEWASQSRVMNPGSGKILVLGDGLGNSSYILHRITKKKVFSSSLSDSSLSFPQTFYNNRPPSSLLLKDPSMIDNTLTRTMICNIFDSRFVREVAKMVSTKKISLIYSEIELEHENSMKGDYDYSDVVESIWATSVYSACLKVRTLSRKSLYNTLNAASKYFELQRGFVTPFCNPNKGEFFLEMESPLKVDEVKHRGWMSEKSFSWCEKNFNMSIGNTVWGSLDKTYYEDINRILIDERMYVGLKKEIERWFSAKSMEHKIESEQHTRLLTSILSNKVSRMVMDKHDKKWKYERLDDLHSILEVMLCLGISSLLHDSATAFHLDSLNDYLMYRPFGDENRSDRSLSNVKYGYVVVHESYAQKLQHRNPHLNWSQDPVRLTSSSNVKRYLPLLRAVKILNKLPLNEGDFISTIQFGYRKAVYVNNIFNEEHCILNVSKTLSRQIIKAVS